MNRLIIIGNGFDLAHGLKTSYEDFFTYYILDCLKKTNSIGNYEDRMLKIRNIPVKELSIKEANNIKDWIRLKRDFDINVEGKSDFINSVIADFERLNWVDIESRYFFYLKRSTDSTLGDVYINRLNRSFEELKMRFLHYLSEIPVKVNKYDSAYDEMKNLIFNNLKGELMVLNFNYTSLAEVYLHSAGKNGDHLINIHGKLGKEESNPIIFGYGDDYHNHYKELEEQNDNRLLKHQKSMLYPRTNNYEKLLLFLGGILTNGLEKRTLLQKNFEVLVLGHSCGLSDRTLLKTIFEHKNCTKIHLSYYESVHDFDSKVIAVSRHFENKIEMRNRLKSYSERLRVPQFNKA